MDTENQQVDQVVPSVSYAGFWLRFLSYWIDFLLLFPLGLIIQGMLGNNPFAVFSVQTLSEAQKLQSSPNQLASVFASIAVGIAYFFIFWVHYDGATPGKKLLGIKIIRENGEKITYPVAIIRYIGFLLSSATIFFFGLGFLWVIWDKKKQALHDKIAGTLVVRDGKGRLGLGILLTLLAHVVFFGYMGATIYKGIRLGLNERAQGNVSASVIQDRLKANQEKDKDKILSYAPTSCGLTLPVPKTTDTKDSKDRKWLFEEVPLAPKSFYVLDKDVYMADKVQGVFIGYKDATARLGGNSFSSAFPGLNIYCADNTKSYTLDEFVSLALANKNYKVEVGAKKALWGEVELMPITLQGKNENGTEFRDVANIGVTKDKSKLLYIRIWSVDEKDPAFAAVDEDINVIVRNLQYRATSSEIGTDDTK